MGLDNGITIKNVTRAQLPRFNYPFDTDYTEGEVEVCYWRKWWSFRNAIIGCLQESDDDETYEYKLSISDVRYIRQLLINYLRHPERFNNANNYWTFDDVKYGIRKDIRNLQLLARWMRHHPDKEVYFTDSY